MRMAWKAVLCLAVAACGGGSHVRNNATSPDDPPATIPAESRAISFASRAPDGMVHVGTLQLPERREGERVPAVIFAHGSGPHDRDEGLEGQLGIAFGFEIPVFREIGDALQEAGFAVLRFDKRTCGPFNGCADNGYTRSSPDRVTIETFIQDVEGGLDFLAGLHEVDPARIFFLGHSKGASYAPRLLADHPGLRAGVMLAAPFRTFDETLRAQVEWLAYLLTELGTPPGQVEAHLAGLRRSAEQLAALRAGTFEGTENDGLPLSYWRSLLHLGEEAPVLALALDRPLLLLFGDYDWNVQPEEAERWAAHLGEGTPHQVRVLPCVTHALNCISNPDWRTVRPDQIGRHVDPAVIEAIVAFLHAQL